MIAGTAAVERLTVRVRLRRFLAKCWEHAITSEWCGNRHPPNDHATLRWERHMDGGQENYRCASWGEDAGTLWIGWANSWDTRIRRRDALRMAGWILWRWAWGDWCGLRRALFYWDLHRRVRHYPIVSGKAPIGFAGDVTGEIRDA